MPKKKAEAEIKLKVEALAKELETDAKQLLAVLKELGIEAKTKASAISEADAAKAKDAIKSGKIKTKAEPVKKPAEKAPAVKSVKKEVVSLKPAEKSPSTVKQAEKPKPGEPKKESKPIVAAMPEAPKQKAVAAEIKPEPKSEPKIETKTAPMIEPKPAPKAEEPVIAQEPVVPVQVAEEVKPEKKQFAVPSEITVKDLAAKLELKVGDVIKELMIKGILATINQRIAYDIASDIVAKFGYEAVRESSAQKEEPLAAAKMSIDPAKLKSRPPVVTIMGHVDHGKTKLLDVIRKTNVIDTEAGGITQHIGAYQVVLHEKTITFLDTPGHEAFTALRARGANITDVIVLVVAADDGVMPQTKEAIDHAKASGAPIIVAINKMDKADANPDRVKQQLSELGLTPEEWGGQTVMVPVSARTGAGVENILEMIILVSELLELKANPSSAASGVIIESFMDKLTGPVATVLVREGSLSVGDSFYSGGVSGKARALINDKNKRIQKVGPGTPVKVLGFSQVPQAGDEFCVMKNDREARQIAESKQLDLDLSKTRGTVISLENFSEKIKEGDIESLNIIIKADVHGSQEALVSSLEDLTTGNIKTNIIRNSTGNITQSDIMLAKASGAVIVGFNVDYDGDSQNLSESEGIDVRMYKIIYEVIDDIKMALEGMLKPEYEEVLTGHAQVRQMFKYSKVGSIAGCFVTDGKIARSNQARVIRKGEMLFEGKINTLKRFKDDVKEVAGGLECGITLFDFEKFIPDDIIETFEMKVKRRSVTS